MSTQSKPTVHELVYGQSWKPTLDASFQPATVRVTKHGDVLELEARLMDSHIHDVPAAFNEEAYRKCDVFELFLKAEGDEHYHELHVTPSNVLLQLRFRVGMPLEVEPAKVWEAIMTSSTERVEGGWIARFTLPLTHFTEQRPVPNLWKIGCGRYDYDASKGEKGLTFSNTAPLTAPNFHRHWEWPVLDLA